ncbi:MAG TPA: GvpL/GvpF family gas vesicle protein [Vicinamibacterales bacterium]|nr:GvpL/GvpF family gas vesicle protein [Vicinamibacterales bacterium]
MNEHVYVYCAIEGTPAALPAAGLADGGAPRALPLHRTVSLVVSDVSSAVYNAEALEARLADLDWVAAAGAAHHAVVDALSEGGVVVLPFRLFTIFSNEAKALATLRQAQAAMDRAFDRVRGRQEWVLRIGKPDPARVLAPQAAGVSPPSGTGFLRAKADARREAIARAERVTQDAASSFDALAQLAEAATSRSVPPGGSLLCDAAFLVQPSRVAALRDALTRTAERLLRDGCPVSLTGPWPPYSFASMEAPADG